MTMPTTQSDSAYMQAFDRPTIFNPVSPPGSSVELRAYDLRSDALLTIGTEDELDLDEVIASYDEPTQAAIAAEGKWVAATFYPGPDTLATLRLKRGLSQKQFAEACKLQQPHVSRYESGKHEPGLLQAQLMASVLGVSLEQIAQAVRQSAK